MKVLCSLIVVGRWEKEAWLDIIERAKLPLFTLLSWTFQIQVEHRKTHSPCKSCASNNFSTSSPSKLFSRKFTFIATHQEQSGVKFVTHTVYRIHILPLPISESPTSALYRLVFVPTGDFFRPSSHRADYQGLLRPTCNHQGTNLSDSRTSLSQSDLHIHSVQSVCYSVKQLQESTK